MTAEMLPVSKLMIDPRVQRKELIVAHAREIAKNFDPKAFGVLTVSRREDGVLILLDGQHRKTALELAGLGDEEVPCHVLDGLTLPQEASLFRALNKTKRVNPLDQFLVSVVQEDPDAVAVNKICEQEGWKIYPGKVDNRIVATSSVLKVYLGFNGERQERNPDALRRTLSVIRGTWGGAHAGVKGPLLLGIGAVFRKHGEQITNEDASTLAERLGEQSGGPGGLLAQAQGLVIGARTLNHGVSFLVVRYHNYKRRTRVLPPWPV